ncbi:tyrosine-type recombinase/integrase [Weissella hellenica]|uniref:tyrosine-type recombinase/integrase n=1 Tax=Weissella hellenica TaxID=46256 RepID=UPI003889AC24
MASIFKRNKGWAASVSVKTETGFKTKSKAGFKTKSEAKAWATKTEAEKQTHGVNMAKDQLLADYFHSWYTVYKKDKAPATYKWYEHIETYLRKYMPAVTLQGLTRPIAQNFLNTLGEKYATATVRKTRSLVHEAIKSAIYDELIFKDPMNGLNAMGKDGKSAELKFLEEPQMKAVVNYIQEITITERNESDEMILLALNTGARYEELAGLTWSDIKPAAIDINKAWDQFERNTKEPKTRASRRVVTVPQYVIDDLMMWKPIHSSTSFIFEKNGKNPITSASANKRLKYILTATHSPKIISFHGLRHTHASWLLSHDVNIQYVSARLGHQSVSMTLKVYTHMLDRTRSIEDEHSISLLKKLQ